MSSARATALSLRCSRGSAPSAREPQASQRALAVDAHVVPREAHHAVPGQLEVGVAGGVALAIAAGAVELEAVELDGQALVGPEGVHLVRGLLSFNCSIEGRGRNVGGGFLGGL